MPVEGDIVAEIGSGEETCSYKLWNVHLKKEVRSATRIQDSENTIVVAITRARVIPLPFPVIGRYGPAAFPTCTNLEC